MRIGARKCFRAIEATRSGLLGSKNIRAVQPAVLFMFSLSLFTAVARLLGLYLDDSYIGLYCTLPESDRQSFPFGTEIAVRLPSSSATGPFLSACHTRAHRIEDPHHFLYRPAGYAESFSSFFLSFFLFLYIFIWFKKEEWASCYPFVLFISPRFLSLCR